MKVICDRGRLVEALGGVSRVVPQRNAADALRCVHLVASDGLLRLAATDAEIGLRLTVDAVEVERDGEALVPVDRFFEIVRSCDDPTLTIETDGFQLRIRGGHSRFVVNGMEPSEAYPVPSMPEAGEVKLGFDIEAGVFGRLTDRTIFAAATETSRYAINGVLVQLSERSLRMVATDGHRLAVAEGRPTSTQGTGDAIIPVKALSVLSRLMDVPDASICVRFTDSQVFVRVGDVENADELSSSLVEGAFPPFEDVIPKDQDKRVTASVDVFARALQQAALYTNKDSKGVRMEFNGDGVKFASRVPEEGEAEVEVELEYEGDPITIGFNAGYLGEALKVLDGGAMTLELKAENKPGVIRTEDRFTYVIMPLHLH